MKRLTPAAPFQGIGKRVPSQGACHALTLTELIGVLAVISILSALLIPKVFEAISMARLNQAALGMGTIKGGVVEHYAQFGSLASSNGVPLVFTGSYTNFDSILLAEGVIDKPFNSRIGTNAFIRLVDISGLTAGTDVDGSNGAYDLDGSGRNDLVGRAFVIDAVFLDVPWREAIALNDLLDGPGLGPNPANHDFRGRVKYRRPTPAQPLVQVHVYITHQ